MPGPSGDACGFSEYMIATLGYLAQLGDGFGEVALSAAYRIAVL